MATKCKACSGSYEDKLKDGSTYYHTCPPIGYKPDGQPIENANKRDENVKLDAEGKSAGIKSTGSGVEAA
jgi:hypothetical protein